jgi:hypothetical protein
MWLTHRNESIEIFCPAQQIDEATNLLKDVTCSCDIVDALALLPTCEWSNRFIVKKHPWNVKPNRTYNPGKWLNL